MAWKRREKRIFRATLARAVYLPGRPGVPTRARFPEASVWAGGNRMPLERAKVDLKTRTRMYVRITCEAENAGRRSETQTAECLIGNDSCFSHAFAYSITPSDLECVEHLRTPLAVLSANGPRPHEELVSQGALAVIYVCDDAGSARKAKPRQGNIRPRNRRTRTREPTKP